MSGPDTAGMREIAAEFLFDFTMRRDNREVRWSDEIGVGALSDETLRSAWRSEADRLLDRLLPVVQRLAVEKAAEARREARRAQEAWDRRRVEDYAAVVGVELTLTPGDDLMRAVDQLYRAALAAAAQPTDDGPT